MTAVSATVKEGITPLLGGTWGLADVRICPGPT